MNNLTFSQNAYGFLLLLELFNIPIACGPQVVGFVQERWSGLLTTTQSRQSDKVFEESDFVQWDFYSYSFLLIQCRAVTLLSNSLFHTAKFVRLETLRALQIINSNQCNLQHFSFSEWSFGVLAFWKLKYFGIQNLIFFNWNTVRLSWFQQIG